MATEPDNFNFLMFCFIVAIVATFSLTELLTIVGMVFLMITVFWSIFKIGVVMQ
jgi:hypothetical protein